MTRTGGYGLWGALYASLAGYVKKMVWRALLRHRLGLLWLALFFVFRTLVTHCNTSGFTVLKVLRPGGQSAPACPP